MWVHYKLLRNVVASDTPTDPGATRRGSGCQVSTGPVR